MPSDDLRPWLRTQGIAGNTIYVLFLGLVPDWKPQILLQCCQKKARVRAALVLVQQNCGKSNCPAQAQGVVSHQH